ncbi:MAG: phage tail tape measure protein [Cyanobacteria bacterium P01_A01_bin.17]
MVGAAAAFTAALTGSILEAIKFQRLWDEANKTLQMSSKELNQLAGDLDKLSFKIPLTRQEFVEMAEQAGNIGIRGRENLVEFIELAAIMGKTFDGTWSAAPFAGSTPTAG